VYKDELELAEERMKEVIESTSRDFAGVRTGRANPALLDRIVIDYYDTPTPLTQIASVSAPEPRLLVVTPWDKSVLGQIERAIQKSDIGLVPANDGNVIRMASSRHSFRKNASISENSPCTSATGRFQFSVENANKVR
jgi:ribosome recycling factor